MEMARAKETGHCEETGKNVRAKTVMRKNCFVNGGKMNRYLVIEIMPAYVLGAQHTQWKS